MTEATMLAHDIAGIYGRGGDVGAALWDWVRAGLAALPAAQPPAPATAAPRGGAQCGKPINGNNRTGLCRTYGMPIYRARERDRQRAIQAERAAAGARTRPLRSAPLHVAAPPAVTIPVPPPFAL